MQIGRIHAFLKLL